MKNDVMSCGFDLCSNKWEKRVHQNDKHKKKGKREKTSLVSNCIYLNCFSRPGFKISVSKI